MAEPLKKTTDTVSPSRLRLNTGTQPTRTVRLVGSNGQVIAPKLRTSAVPTPPTEVPTPEVQTLQPVPQEESVAGVMQQQAEVVAEAPVPEDRGQAEAVVASPLLNVDAQYIEQLRQNVAKPPIWKSKGFIFACVGIVVVGGICGALIMQHNAKLDAKREENARIMKVLRRAQKINQQNIETLSQAKEKNVNVKCTMAEAKFLMKIVVDPAMKDDEGKPLFGGHPDGVAQLACMLLSIASEENADICKYVFERLNKDAAKIKSVTYRWLVQRLATADIKGINEKLRKLADQIAGKSAKKLRQRDDLLSYIWESMGLRVTSEDIPALIEILKKPDTANGLIRTISICLDNIIEMEESPDKKKELGDQIFDAVPEKTRAYLVTTFGKSASPKALAYYKQRASDKKNWNTDKDYFASYSQDDIVAYLQQELMPLAADDARNKKLVESMVAGVLRQNRDRTPEDAHKLIKLVYDQIDEDTSEWSSIDAQVDPDSGTFIGESNPKYKELVEKKEKLDVARAQKINLIRVLSSMYDWPWVVQLLENYTKDSDVLLAADARNALEKVKKNREASDKLRSNYKRRTEPQP